MSIYRVNIVISYGYQNYVMEIKSFLIACTVVTDFSKNSLTSKFYKYLKRFQFNLLVHWSNQAIFSTYCTESSAYSTEYMVGWLFWA